MLLLCSFEDAKQRKKGMTKLLAFTHLCAAEHKHICNVNIIIYKEKQDRLDDDRQPAHHKKRIHWITPPCRAT